MRIRIFISSLVFSVLMLVVVGNDMFNNKSTTDALVAAHPNNDRQVLTHKIATYKTPFRLEPIKETSEDSDTIQHASTDEMELLESDEVLMDMIQEYEDVKSAPELRTAHREKMAEKLSTHSDLVLSIALEKMKERKENNIEG